MQKIAHLTLSFSMVETEDYNDNGRDYEKPKNTPVGKSFWVHVFFSAEANIPSCQYSFSF